MQKVSIGAAALSIVTLGLYYWLRPVPESAAATISVSNHAPTSTPGASAPISTLVATQLKKAGEIFMLPYHAPITFYGKVIDQHGNPVPNVDVEFTINDTPDERPHDNTYKRRTDAAGLFSITGVHGIAMLVRLQHKVGYIGMYAKDGKLGSGGGFNYGLDTNGTGIHHPNANAPVIFTLYKLGVLEPLVRLHNHSHIERDGTPLSIQLDPQSSKGAHMVVLRCWNTDKDQRRAPTEQYDWRLEIAVTDGGIVQRDNSNNYEAPEAGYATSTEINMKASLPRKEWTDQAERSFFMRFNDGCYGRIDLEMTAGGAHYVEWLSFLNPKSGSRNLETDPFNR